MPGIRFERAISHGDMIGAETAAFELGSLSLKNALAHVAFYASAADRKFDRAAVPIKCASANSVPGR